MSVSPVPEQGQLVEVRRRQYVVTEVQRLQAVIAELSAENLQLKKGRWR